MLVGLRTSHIPRVFFGLGFAIEIQDTGRPGGNGRFPPQLAGLDRPGPPGVRYTDPHLSPACACAAGLLLHSRAAPSPPSRALLLRSLPSTPLRLRRTPTRRRELAPLTGESMRGPSPSHSVHRRIPMPRGRGSLIRLSDPRRPLRRRAPSPRSVRLSFASVPRPRDAAVGSGSIRCSSSLCTPTPTPTTTATTWRPGIGGASTLVYLPH